MGPHKDLQVDVFSNFVFKSPKVETILMSIN